MMAEAGPLLITQRGHVQTWTLNIVDQRNAITRDVVVEAVVAAAERVALDESVRCIILTGAGSAFSSGGNVKDMKEGLAPFGSRPYQASVGYRTGIQKLARAVMDCEVPIIAAVNGPAVGAGCDLALMCDLRIASTEAVFAESFVKLGLVSGDGGAWLLPKVIGPARAAEMIFTGEPVNAAIALDWGLVSRVVAPSDLMSAAQSLADRIAVNPPLAIRMSKRLLGHASHQRFDEALDLAGAVQALAHHTDDHALALRGPSAEFTAR